MFNNLRELITSLPDEKSCRDFLAKQRWQDGKPICPYCGCSKCYVIENGKRFKCGNSECYKKFSVTVGTVFEASNVPLVKWFSAIYLCTAHKKGISSYQLGRDIGVAQKTAWFMLHRIRELMRVKSSVKLNAVVEVDETYIGGKVANMSNSKRRKLREENKQFDGKHGVMGLLQRDGELKLVDIAKETKAEVLRQVIKDNVEPAATIVTDSLHGYVALRDEFARHEAVNHTQKEYARGIYHTNSIEGFFSILKRGIYGIYHQVSPKHLSRYCDEFSYRYNSRKIKDADRFTISLQKVEGRLDYKTLVGKK